MSLLIHLVINHSCSLCDYILVTYVFSFQYVKLENTYIFSHVFNIVKKIWIHFE